jgi:hypothetical protein
MAGESVLVSCSHCDAEIPAKCEQIQCYNCSKVFHSSCTELSTAELKSTQKKLNLVYVCKFCLVNKVTSPSEVQMLRDVIDKLSLIVTTNTCQINSLTQDLKSLQNKQGNNTKLLNKPTKTPRNVGSEKSAVLNINTEATPTQMENCPSKAKNEDDDFILVKSRKKLNNKIKPIIGTRPVTQEADKESTCLKAMVPPVRPPKQAHLYVGRLHPSTTTDDVEWHIYDHTPVKKVEVTKVDSKSEYSAQFAAFKVSFDYEHLETLTNPNVWPTGSLVNKYFFPKRVISQNPI